LKSKTNQAALGLRVKSGWAAAILLAGPVRSPRLCDIRVIDLCDPKIPATRQPYHAAMGKLETNAARLRSRLQIVRRVAKQSIATLLGDYRRNGYRIRRAGLGVGSQIDPALIANPHIRAHALEGQLFRTELADALRAHQIQSVVLIEREALAKTATLLKKSPAELQSVVNKMRRTTSGPWRAEQKLATIAAWFALAHDVDLRSLGLLPSC
jgi:hypothetical protein